MMCGYTDVVPSVRRRTEQGIHRPGLSSSSSRAAPAAAPLATPSPVFVSGASELPGRRRKQLCAQLLVPGDAAGREHDALAGPDGVRPCGPRTQRTDHPAVLEHQLGELRVEQDRNVLLAQAVKQARGERVAHDQVGAALVAQAVERRGGHQPRHVRERFDAI